MRRARRVARVRGRKGDDCFPKAASLTFQTASRDVPNTEKLWTRTENSATIIARVHRSSLRMSSEGNSPSGDRMTRLRHRR